MTQHTRADLEYVTNNIDRYRLNQYRGKCPPTINLDDLRQAALTAYIAGVNRLNIGHLPVDARLKILSERIGYAIIDELRNQEQTGTPRGQVTRQYRLDWHWDTTDPDDPSRQDWLTNFAGLTTPSAETEALKTWGIDVPHILGPGVTKAIAALPERTRQIFLRRINGEPLTQVAADYGVAISRISQITSDTRAHLRHIRDVYGETRHA